MDAAALDVKLALVASRQAGAFTWGQARACGFGKATIGRRLRSGQWERTHPGVYVMAAAARTRSLELWIAVLAVGSTSVLSHESAALVHGARGLPPWPITLTAPHGSHHRLAGVTVHQIDDVAGRHRTTVDGLPVVTAARALVDLGSRVPLDRLGEVVDDLVQARATTWAGIASVFRDLVRPGKPGMATVASLLDDRCGAGVPADSRLERALLSALAAGGLPQSARCRSPVVDACVAWWTPPTRTRAW